MRRYLLLVTACAALAASGANCLDFLNWGKNDRTARLRAFSSADELRAFFADQAKESTRRYYGPFPILTNLIPSFGGMAPSAGGRDDAVDTTDGEAGAAGDQDYSGTNIQEAGVDESDVVKNDGEYIYVLDGDTIHIAKADPPDQLAEVASVQIPPYGDSLYLRGDKLVAISQQWVYYPLPLGVDDIAVGSAGAGAETSTVEPGKADPDGTVSSADSTAPDPGSGIVEDGQDDLIGGPWNDGSQVTITIIDVSDPANPAVAATVKLEGSLSSSRLIESKLHVVLTTTPRLPEVRLLADYDKITLDEWLPDYEVEDGEGNTQSGNIVGWEGFVRPDDPQGYGITTVVTVNIDDPTGEMPSSAIVADAGIIYASTAALYVTDTDYGWEGFREVSRTDTAVHKFRFTDTGTEYAGSGLVNGRPLNQYSLGEYEDYLRIATTIEDWGSSTSQVSNAVYVLGKSGDELKTMGSIEDIAPGETMYSARFVGNRGFMVTFKRTDPLFTMDLTDPTNPQLAGELKVPGYSDHIQLLDENHLLTIGKDAEDDGDWAWVKGVQLSVFDVTDLSNPQLLHREAIGGRGTNSEANYNPKAFNFYAARNALAFPIDVYDAGDSGNPWSYGEYKFTGLMVYQVTVADGFQYLGGISSINPEEVNGCYWGYYGGFTRGVFIGDNVFSVMPDGVKAAALSDVSTLLGDIQFAGSDPPYDYCGGWVEPMVIAPDSSDLR